MIGALGRLLVETLARSTGDVADATGKRMSAADLLEQAATVAKALSASGLTTGEPAFVIIANRVGDLSGLLGVWMAGGVAVPIHASASPTTWDAVRTALRARAMVDDRAVSLANLAPPAPRAELSDAALVVFTSGTTGTPKGVVIRHEGFAGKLAALDPVIRFTPDDLVAVPLQLTFIFGQWVAFLGLLSGSRVALMPRFSADACADPFVVRATALGAVPSMLRAMLQAPVQPLPCLRTIVSGGEPLGAALSQRVLAAWPRAPIYDLYGLTETGAADFCSVSAAERSAGAWIGRPTAGVAYRIVAADGSSAARGMIGELQIRSDHAMAGYLGAPDLTKQAYADGYFFTGDLAVEDPNGLVRLVGRIKDVISRAGNKIYPAEIETALLLHADVAAALCIGVPDADIGERIYATVVLAKGSVTSVTALQAFAAERLERYKVPDFLDIRNELPLGTTGKVSRIALRDIFLRDDQSSRSRST